MKQTIATLLLVGAGIWITGCSGNKVVSAPPPAREPAPTQTAAEYTDQLLREIAAKPDKPLPGAGWQVLLNPETMANWKVTEFAGGGEVESGHGVILLNMGDPFTGVNCTNVPLPSAYELAFDAMRVSGSDFFCGLTIPVNDSHCSLILGGWGGSLVGISSLNEMDASENETTTYKEFVTKRWYAIRLRVTEKKLQVWIDEERVIDLNLADHRVALRFGEIERSKPLGFASWQTAAAYRNIRYRAVEK